MYVLLRFFMTYFRLFVAAPFISLKGRMTKWRQNSAYTFVPKDLALTETQNGNLKCVGCQLCVVVCPTQAIFVETKLDDLGNPYPSSFKVDMSKCISCGLCERVCPVNAIMLVPQKTLAVPAKQELLHRKETLQQNGQLLSR